MGTQPPPASLFEDAVDIPLWLEHDRASDLTARLQRDRRIGRQIASRSPLRRVREWWQQLDAGERPAMGARLQHARVLVTFVLALAGLVIGAGLTLAVFRYEGDYPVNVIAAIALLAGLPFLMALLTLLLLPGRVPGLRPLQDAIAAINVGTLVTPLFDRFARTSASGHLQLAWPSARSGAAARFARWQVLCWSQWFGTWFSLGALGMAVLLVVFTDLAFGWSTTLDVDSADVQRLTGAIATPWAAWLPGAVPDAALIAESRYFRIEGIARDQIPTGRLTGWWPFVLMALIVYALLPRVLLLILARWRLSVATRALLLDDHHVRALLDRMETAVLESAANGDERTSSGIVEDAELAPSARLAARARVLVWNRALAGDAFERWIARHFGSGVTQRLEAGGQSIDADEDTVRSLDARDTTMLVVVTKAWEPPMLDFIDFLARLRERVSAGTSIVIVPVGIDGAVPDADAVKTWRLALARHADPGIYVQELA